MPSPRQLVDPRHEPDRRHGHPARAHPEPGRRGLGEAAYGADHGLVVGQRLAHAHEHDVGDPGRSARDLVPRQRPGTGHDLLDDLGGGHVALESALARGAERTRHAAAGLGRDAHRHPVGVAHQHRLDQRVVEQPPQGLPGRAAIGLERADRRHQRRQERRDDLVPPVGGEVGHRRRVVDEPVEVVRRHLPGPERREPELRRRTRDAPPARGRRGVAAASPGRAARPSPGEASAGPRCQRRRTRSSS